MAYHLTDIATIRTLLAQTQAAPRKSAGQNFLICDEVVDATIAALLPDTPVTELGPGLGTLTQAITHGNFHVRAIEIDRAFVRLLPKTVKPPDLNRFELIHGDVLSEPWNPTTNPYQLVGNIPYNITGRIIRQLTSNDETLRQAVLLIQTEVARRLEAGPECPSLLTLARTLWGTADRILQVPATCFWPQPKVSSSLIVLTPHLNNPHPPDKRAAIIKFATPFYQQKRKQLGSVFKKLHPTLPPEKIETILHSLELKATDRPEIVTADQWMALTEQLQNLV